MLDSVCASSDKFDYIVLTDSQGIRLYHPDPALVGEPFSGGDEAEALKAMLQLVMDGLGE